jgi:hypothetical protein
MLDYVQASGDVDFLRKHRKNIESAWNFETTHDSDGDGIYDNAQGTGWVESWPGGMPKQEIYLALLDQQASTAMSKLSAMLGDDTTSKSAATRATTLSAKIESEYFQSATNKYAFSHNPDGSLDKTRTSYPSIAWWNSYGTTLKNPDTSFHEWDSHIFSTDWGVRDVAEDDPVYDPISYHQGSVWPLFTGWASLADYRSGRPLSGYAHLMQNADQTTTQDLGGVTELLSGAFFIPFGRSTSHQLWSSSMVITPALRGLFGIRIDAAMDAHFCPPTPAPTAQSQWSTRPPSPPQPLDRPRSPRPCTPHPLIGLSRAVRRTEATKPLARRVPSSRRAHPPLRRPHHPAERLWAATRYTGADLTALQVEVTGVQFAWYFRYPGPDATFGRTNLKLVAPGEGNPLGIDPADPALRRRLRHLRARPPANREVDLPSAAQDVIHGFSIPRCASSKTPSPARPSTSTSLPPPPAPTPSSARNSAARPLPHAGQPSASSHPPSSHLAGCETGSHQATP